MGGPELIIAAAAAQMLGQAQQTKSEAAALNYAKNIEYAKSSMALKQGLTAKAAAVQRENLERKKGRQIQGMQRAALGTTGLDSSSGSALDIQLESSSNLEMKYLMERYKGDLDKMSSDMSAANFRAQGNAYEQQADDVQAALPLRLASMGLLAAGMYGKVPGGAGGGAAGGNGAWVTTEAGQGAYDLF